MRRLHPRFLLGLVVLSAATAAVRDLQPDLAYVPLAELVTAELPADRARVIDARATAASSSSAELVAWFTAPTAPTLVLLDDQLPAWLTATLATRSSRLLTLAARDYATPLADITVDTTRAADQAARAALADPAADLDILLVRNATKRRFDEAALVEARDNRTSTRRPAPAVAPATDAANAATPPPPTDLVLQRAVQIHQGLRALGRW